MIIGLVLSALGFAIGMYVTLKVIGKGKAFSKLFFTGIATGLVSMVIAPVLISLFPFLGLFSVVLTALINFIVIYKMLGIGLLWTIFALILNVVISFLLEIAIPIVIVLIIGILS